MKKVFVIATMIVATLSANAQAEEGSLTIQPHMGGTGSTISNADFAPNEKGYKAKLDKDANAGGIFGVELEYQLSKKFSVAGGLNFMQAGTAWKDTSYGGVKFKDMKVETSYVAVPLVANYYVCKGLALKAGVQFAFLTEAKSKFTAEEGNIRLSYDSSCKDQFNKFDLSIPVGISYEFKVPIVIDLRYNIGLTKVNKNANIFGDSGNNRNNAVTLTVGYKFKL